MDKNANLDRDSYYIFKPEFPKLEILRRYITKAQTEAAVAYFNQEGFDPNAYIKGHKSGLWVPLLYQCLQDKRLTPLIKILLKKGGNVAKRPDGEAAPLLFVCDDVYYDYLVKRLPFDRTTIGPNLHYCFLYGKCLRIEKMLDSGVLTKADLEICRKAYPDLAFEMIDTCVKYLTYYYGAQIKKGDPDVNLKQCTMETLEKYVNLCKFLKVECITPEAINLCVRYYLFELLQAFQTQGVIFSHGLCVKYAIGGAKEAVMRPLLNDYRYEQTCLLLQQEPEKSIYESYNPV